MLIRVAIIIVIATVTKTTKIDGKRLNMILLTTKATIIAIKTTNMKKISISMTSKIVATCS